MIFPPSILRIRIKEQDSKGLGLCLPLFLIWPIILAIGILLAPVVLLAAFITWPKGTGKRLLLAGPYLFNVFCRVRGLRVKVKDKEDNVYISFS
ncbi:MAG TPA: hypothetical protein PLU88_00400 [Armatimonadota bacterium]|jgi:hypothetical protein|nr:hypothetical protein [Armatimonadota bacterium]